MPDTHGAAPLGGKKPAPQKPQTPQESPQGQEIQYPPALAKSQHARYRQFLALKAENQRNELELGQRYGAGIQQVSVVGLRLSVLMDMIWPERTQDGAQQRLEHDLRYQEALASQWESLRRQVAQARLAAGGQLSPEEMAVVQNTQRKSAPGLFGG